MIPKPFERKCDFVEEVANHIEDSVTGDIEAVFRGLRGFCARVLTAKDIDDMADECLCVWIRCREDMGNWNGDDDGPYDRLVGRMSEGLSQIWDKYVPTKQSENEIRDL